MFDISVGAEEQLGQTVGNADGCLQQRLCLIKRSAPLFCPFKDSGNFRTLCINISQIGVSSLFEARVYKIPEMCCLYRLTPAYFDTACTCVRGCRPCACLGCVCICLCCVCVCVRSLRGRIIAAFGLQEQMFGFVNTGAQVCSGSPGE